MNPQVAAVASRALALFLLVGSVVTLGGGRAWAAPTGSPWGAKYFPNVELTTQDGKKVRFYDDLIKDKVVAIDFIFTHCTATCPAETAALKQVEKALGERMGKDVFFYSISIDGKRDDPAALKEYAQKFKTGPGWTFLTGSKEDVDLIRKKLGLYRGDPSANGDAKLSQHDTHLIVGNEAKGKWIKRSPFGESSSLARMLSTTLQTSRQPTSSLLSYSQAPQLPNPGMGEKLFRSRCDTCHSLGTQEGIGPGLAGVTTNRDRSWLKRWLKAPDKMIEAKDPLALALYAKYNKIYMPNLRLSDNDVEALIQYMESTTTLTQNLR